MNKPNFVCPFFYNNIKILDDKICKLLRSTVLEVLISLKIGGK